MNELNSVSVYYLLLELFDGGNCGILPELETITEISLIKELERQTGQTFQTDKKAWANWFLLEAEGGSELERENFLGYLAAMNFQLS
ncbi:MAG: hypothetical protein AAFQ64_00640 [Pseudomonadota bacterium]